MPDKNTAELLAERKKYKENLKKAKKERKKAKNKSKNQLKVPKILQFLWSMKDLTVVVVNIGMLTSLIWFPAVLRALVQLIVIMFTGEWHSYEAVAEIACIALSIIWLIFGLIGAINREKNLDLFEEPLSIGAWLFITLLPPVVSAGVYLVIPFVLNLAFM